MTGKILIDPLDNGLEFDGATIFSDDLIIEIESEGGNRTDIQGAAEGSAMAIKL